MPFISLNIQDIIKITDFLFIQILIKNFVQLVIKDKIYIIFFYLYIFLKINEI